jgi:CIC family chloride channel protein
VFAQGIQMLNQLLRVTPPYVQTGMSGSLQLLGVLLAGSLLVGVLQRGKALGPVDTIEATHCNAGRIDLHTSMRGTLASFIALASGASAGLYGPLVHFGASIGALISRARPFAADMATIGVGCGVSAAIAAAFSAPIAGVIFAHEILLRHYSLRAFAPITVAAITGHLFGSSLFDAETLAVLHTVDALPPLSYLALAVLGILSALFAKYFMHLVDFSDRMAERSMLPGWSKPVCAALILWLVALLIPEVLGTGLLPLRQTLAGEFGAADTALLLIAKTLVTAVCLGFGFAGGIFSPALLLGTLFGSLFAVLISLTVPSLLASTPVFAVGAMAAVASAVIGAPLTAILIVFELTHDYELTIAVMITVVFANLVSFRLYGRSFYDLRLRMRGIDFSMGVERVRLQHEYIDRYLADSFLTLSSQTTVWQARDRMLAEDTPEAHIVDSAGGYVGVLHLRDLELSVAQSPTEPVISHAVQDHLYLTGATSVWQAMQALENFQGESVPVVNDQGVYLGALFESAVIRAYLDTLDEIRKEANAIG